MDDDLLDEIERKHNVQCGSKKPDVTYKTYDNFGTNMNEELIDEFIQGEFGFIEDDIDFEYNVDDDNIIHVDDSDFLAMLEKENLELADCTQNSLTSCDSINNPIVLSSSSVINNSSMDQLNYCCLCGNHKNDHNDQLHKFFASYDDYRCKKCNKFFYQHNHCKNPCFNPHQRIS